MSIQNQVSSTKFIAPYNPNYNVTKSLWNKETTSDSLILSAIQRISFVAAAAIAAVTETVRNTLAVSGNIVIWPINFVASFFKKPVTPETLLPLVTPKSADSVTDAPKSIAPKDDPVLTLPPATCREKFSTLRANATNTVSTLASNAIATAPSAVNSAVVWTTTAATTVAGSVARSNLANWTIRVPRAVLNDAKAAKDSDILAYLAASRPVITVTTAYTAAKAAASKKYEALKATPFAQKAAQSEIFQQTVQFPSAVKKDAANIYNAYPRASVAMAATCAIYAAASYFAIAGE